MVGASTILPQLMAAGETTAQLYLTSFMMDEARHFEQPSQPRKDRGLPNVQTGHRTHSIG